MKMRTASRSDLTGAALPHTRREVFSDICALYGGMLFKIGLLLIIFAAPSLFVGFLADQNELAYMAAIIPAGERERAAIYQEYQVTDGLFSLLNIVGAIIFSVGLSGAARVIRQHAWEESVNLKLDFIRGIRQNVRSYLILSFLTGCWCFLTKYCFVGALYAKDGGGILNLLPLIVGLFALLPILSVALVVTAIYVNSFRKNLRISMLVFLKRPLPAIGLSILIVLPILAASAIASIPIRLLLRMMNILFLPFLFFVWFLWSLNQLDRFINAAHYPELVGRGLIHEL